MDSATAPGLASAWVLALASVLAWALVSVWALAEELARELAVAQASESALSCRCRMSRP